MPRERARTRRRQLGRRILRLSECPLIQTHTRGTIAAVAGGVLGRKVLATADLNKLLSRVGLQDVRESSSDDVSDLFTAASRLMRQQAKSNPCSWALCCPLVLLGITWPTPALAVAVDGSHYPPLTHPSSRGHGTDRKRLVLCVAAHVSLFWAKIFEVHVAASHASGCKKRYRPKDVFEGAENIVGGPAHALAWLLRGDWRATFCGDSADSRPTAWNGRSAIWRHNNFLRAGPVHDQDNENDVHAAKSHAKCALKDNLLTSVGTATLTSYSDDITFSKRS